VGASRSCGEGEVNDEVAGRGPATGAALAEPRFVGVVVTAATMPALLLPASVVGLVMSAAVPETPVMAMMSHVS
jgi:hypothetical protein